jgi:hypothetical protein
MDLTTKTETITFGQKKILGIFKKDIKFKVVADMPDSLLEDYAEIAKGAVDGGGPEEQRKAFKALKQVIAGLLYQANDKKKVDKFVNKLGMHGSNRIFEFLNKYINEVAVEKKNE